MIRGARQLPLPPVVSRDRGGPVPRRRSPRPGPALKLAAALLLSLAFGCDRVPCRAAPGPATLAELQTRLDDHLSQTKFDGALWGVKVVSLDSGRTVFEKNPQKLLSPASNTKLYTVALALDRFGGDHRLRTSLYARGRPTKAGTLAGDLVLYGRGDPTLNARRHGNDIFLALAKLVAALTNAGVRKISGDLVADASFFRGPDLGSGWAWDDTQYYYGARISALTINDNLLELRVAPGDASGKPCQLELLPLSAELVLENRTTTAAAGGRRSISLYRPPEARTLYVSGQLPLGAEPSVETVTTPDPPALFGALFREALRRQGVALRGGVRTLRWPGELRHPESERQLTELAGVDSPTLREIVREIQKPSQNLYTDLLLAYVGEHTRTPSAPEERTSEDLGILELQRFLEEIGIAATDVRFEEGSGLSRNNLVTARATVALLQHMSAHRWAGAFIDALPVAGLDGTLRSRMKGTAAEGNVRAKTGSLRWANSLSGYVTTAAGERMAFSILLNRYHNPDPQATARGELDRVAILLAEFSGRSDQNPVSSPAEAH